MLLKNMKAYLLLTIIFFFIIKDVKINTNLSKYLLFNLPLRIFSLYTFLKSVQIQRKLDRVNEVKCIIRHLQ